MKTNLYFAIILHFKEEILIAVGLFLVLLLISLSDKDLVVEF